MVQLGSQIVFTAIQFAQCPALSETSDFVMLKFEIFVCVFKCTCARPVSGGEGVDPLSRII